LYLGWNHISKIKIWKNRIRGILLVWRSSMGKTISFERKRITYRFNWSKAYFK